MRIGIDFDNTIAGYDDVFRATASDQGWVPDGFSGTKRAVRDAVRRLDDGETKWQVLQGMVYGRRMGEARMIDGVGAFLASCTAKGLAVFIISHKTRTANHDPQRVDLRRAATEWMTAQEVIAPGRYGVPPENVFFESTRADKLARIAGTGCTHFIDDLEEVFGEPDFPDNVERVLLAAGDGPLPSGPFRAFPGWPEITHALFGADAPLG